VDYTHSPQITIHIVQMELLESLVCVDKNLPTPVYLQVANDVICSIRKGILKPGAALPGSRVLAQSLNLHRKTVVAAYDELYAQSWVDVLPRKGIFVAKNLPNVAPRALVASPPRTGFSQETLYEVDDARVICQDMFVAPPDGNLVFNNGSPDTRIAPLELMIREYRRLASHKFNTKYLMYGPEQGSENLRTELAKFFSETRGLHVSPDNIIITKGVQMALYIIAQVLLNKGDTVIVGDPGYSMANEVFTQAGAVIAPVPVDEFGINLNAVEALCKKQKIRMLFVIPHHHQPTTVTLCSERRMRLLELAKTYKFAIVEDDYDYDFHYSSSPILPLASADDYGSVIYVGSFCKTIASGLRIGFMIAPQNLIKQATRLRRLIDRQGRAAFRGSHGQPAEERRYRPPPQKSQQTLPGTPRRTLPPAARETGRPGIVQHPQRRFCRLDGIQKRRRPAGSNSKSCRNGPHHRQRLRALPRPIGAPQLRSPGLCLHERKRTGRSGRYFGQGGEEGGCG
jgi:GntR family transcriptional regulator/MocR family aminotransferase